MAEDSKGAASPLSNIIDSIGFGPWTLLHIAPALLAPVATVNNLIIGEFLAPPLEFWCTDPGQPSRNVSINGNVCELQRLGANGSITIDFCRHFSYNTSMFTTTVTAEFDLVCSRSWYRQLFQLLFTLGSVIGAPAGGLVGDMYGRRTALFYSSLLMAACTVTLTTASSLEVVLGARFFLGLFSYMTCSPALTIVMEVCPTSLRTVYGVVEGVSYALALPLLAGLAYACRQWRRLQLYSSFPLLLLVLLSCPLVMDESPRWLVTRGRFSASERALRRAARLHRANHELPADLGKVLMEAYECEQSDESLSPKLWSLVSTAEMRKLTFIFLTMGLIEGVLYITLPLEASSFQSPFLYMTLLGLLELPASVVMVMAGPRCGRVTMTAAISGLLAALFAVMAIVKAEYGSVEWALLLLSALEYVSLMVFAQFIILLTAELFPTTVRGLGTSLGMLTNNIGYCLPPLIKAATPQQMPWLPSVINSVLSCLNACLVLLLPETRKRPLLQTVDDHINYSRGREHSKKGLRPTGELRETLV